MEPFKSFLRTAATAFFFDRRPHFTPGETNGATHQAYQNLRAQSEVEISYE